LNAPLHRTTPSNHPPEKPTTGTSTTGLEETSPKVSTLTASETTTQISAIGSRSAGKPITALSGTSAKCSQESADRTSQTALQTPTPPGAIPGAPTAPIALTSTGLRMFKT
jgi:hypothetical protein